MTTKQTKKSLVSTLALLASVTLFTPLFGCSDDNGSTVDAGRDGLGDAIDTILTPDKAPGDLSEKQKLKITAIVPNNGPACPFAPGGAEGNCDGQIPVLLVGQNFTTGAAVYVEGGGGYIITAIDVPNSAALSFMLKKQPYDEKKPFKSFIEVRIGDQKSNTVSFQYWVTKPATADATGSVTSATVDAFSDFPSQPISGKIFIKGKTDTTTGAAATNVKVQFGVSVKGKDPVKDHTFMWFDATYKSDDATYDTYEGTVTPVLTGDFDVAMRFSEDGGKTWIFVDMDETDPAYDPAKAATLKVVDPPLKYCQKKEDCNLEMYARTCKLNPSDWKAHRCVQCLADKDCTENPNSLGPKCEVSKTTCICATDDDCKTIKNGKKCLTNYCGCEQPTDCEEPNVCYKDTPAKGMFGCGPPQNNP